MSAPDDPNDELVQLVFAGTPDRVIDTVAGSDARAMVDPVRSAIAQFAAAVAPTVQPSAGLRDRIRAAIEERPRATRREAVLVVDMIEDYLTPGRPLHVPRARDIIGAVRDRIERARRDGTPVLYLCDQHEPGDPDLETWPLHAVAGTTGGSVIPEIAPRDGDVVIPHRTYSAFFESNLEKVLRGLDVNTLVMTGCATEFGLLATATDALMRGYSVEVPPETQAGTSAEAERVALGVLQVMRPLPQMIAR
jgi:nicotinamidase-related amidase